MTKVPTEFFLKFCNLFGKHGSGRQTYRRATIVQGRALCIPRGQNSTSRCWGVERTVRTSLKSVILPLPPSGSSRGNALLTVVTQPTHWDYEEAMASGIVPTYHACSLTALQCNIDTEPAFKKTATKQCMDTSNQTCQLSQHLHS